MKKNDFTLGKVLLAALLSLFLGASCFVAGPGVPADLGEALRGGVGGASSAVGPVGAALAGLAAWAVGPWLRWLLVLVPWIWLPLQTGKAKGRSRARRRMLWSAAVLLLGLVLLGHPALQRLGVPVSAGGVVGETLHNAVQSMLGGLGAFLVPAGILAFLLIRALPPIHIELPFLDRLQSGLGGLGRGFGAFGRWAQALGSRASQTLEAWRARRAEAADRRRIEEDERREAEGPATEEVVARAPARIIHAEQDALPAPGHPAQNARELAAPAPARMEQDLDEQEHDYEDPGQSRPGPTLPNRTESEDPQGEFALSRDPAELLREQQRALKKKRRRQGGYPMPSLDLLQDVRKEERGFSKEVLQMNARLLLETLSSFGIEGRINEIRPGPVVTTFEFEPDRGVKVNQITSRADDLALAMRAIRIRIVAPIPGKAAVGIEVPNAYPQMVTLKEVIAPIMAGDKATPLTVGLGKDTEGNPVSADLAEMPHVLVAGATGSGKSVCLNALICSLLLRNDPDQLKMLMIDPKMIELSLYNGIPHLVHPVITEPKEALKALKIMVVEMSSRYNRLAKQGVRNILDYNERIKSGKVKDAEGKRVDETMHYIVVIVDELADLMMLLGAELETPIARLAQMARAVGIHLVLATQRPSVNVITGVIKANFPSRIGFRVISKVDSRTILDVMGAEALLGKGDSLFVMGGMSQPRRVHGAFLSTDECEAIAGHWIPLADEPSSLDLSGTGEGGSALDLGEDDLLEDAKRIVVLAQSGSTSMLQRKLRVGYTRAARLMDMLEEVGVVGPFEGSKAREVLIKMQDLEAEAEG